MFYFAGFSAGAGAGAGAGAAGPPAAGGGIGGPGISAPGGVGGGVAGLFGIACLMMKKSATRMIIIRIATAAGLLFFWSAMIHLLSFNETKK